MWQRTRPANNWRRKRKGSREGRKEGKRECVQKRSGGWWFGGRGRGGVGKRHHLLPNSVVFILVIPCVNR